jgi:hypothetical protein
MPRKTIKRKSRGGGNGPRTLAKKIKPVAETVYSEIKDIVKELAKDQAQKTPKYLTRKKMSIPNIKIKSNIKRLESKDDIHIPPFVEYKTPNKNYKLPKDDTFFTPPPSSRKYSTNTYAKKKSPENKGAVITHMANLNEVRETLFK